MRRIIGGAPIAHRQRAILFRVAAVLLGLLPLLAIEVVLRVLGLGQADLRHDPFVGFNSIRPLFELNESQDRYEVASSRLSHFCPDSFLVSKPEDEFRVFCIGDSTVQGNPWSVETSFTTWLEIGLTAAQPSRRWNVVNCGGISYASYRMVPILEEVLRHQPDLIILHCSHNEFLEDRSYELLKRTPRFVWRLQELVAKLRLYQVLSSISNPNDRFEISRPQLTSGSASSRTVLSNEVQALLDYRGGLEWYHHDAEWQQHVIEHYRFNLNRMATLAKRSNVPMILLNPACNLRDCPPFKAENRPELSSHLRNEFSQRWAEARSYYTTDPDRAIQLLRQAQLIDNQHAGLHYDLAKCLERTRNFSGAYEGYLQAKEWDTCPLRILETMRDVVRDVGDSTQTPVLDLMSLFRRLSRDGIPGDGWFVDHVHPTIPGYQRVADELIDELTILAIVQPQPEWLEIRQRRYSEHLDSLPTMYFLGGQRRLEALMLWANGRASKELPKSQ